MTNLQQAVVVTQAVAVGADVVYDFARQMENLPRWASGLAAGITQQDGHWFADWPMGRVRVDMADANRFGVLDHDVTLPDGTRVHNALRVTPSGDGSLLSFVVLRAAGASDQDFHADVAHVKQDLAALSSLLGGATATDEPASAASLAAKAKTPFPGASAAYDAARQALLAEEIDFRRHMTRLTAQRGALPPGPVIEKDYRFKDEQAFETGLLDLFGDKDTLVTYFWMYGPQRGRPCPMCTNLLGSLNGNAADIKQRVALKVLGRSSVERQYAFAQERGWRDLNFVQTVGDDYANDLGLLTPDGNEMPALTVYQRDGDKVRLFWASEMTKDMADPDQDPRDAPDIAALWTVLDLTPGGRGKDWYPKLAY